MPHTLSEEVLEDWAASYFDHRTFDPPKIFWAQDLLFFSTAPLDYPV